MDSATAYMIQHGYVVLFAWVAAEQLALPVPSEPVLLAVGALAGAVLLRLPFTIAVGVGVSLLSDGIWYEIGRARGSQVTHLLCRRQDMSDQASSPSGPDLAVGIPTDSLQEGVPLPGHVEREPVILLHGGGARDGARDRKTMRRCFVRQLSRQALRSRRSREPGVTTEAIA